MIQIHPLSNVPSKQGAKFQICESFSHLLLSRFELSTETVQRSHTKTNPTCLRVRVILLQTVGRGCWCYDSWLTSLHVYSAERMNAIRHRQKRAASLVHCIAAHIKIRDDCFVRT